MSKAKKLQRVESEVVTQPLVEEDHSENGIDGEERHSDVGDDQNELISNGDEESDRISDQDQSISETDDLGRGDHMMGPAEILANVTDFSNRYSNEHLKRGREGVQLRSSRNRNTTIMVPTGKPIQLLKLDMESIEQFRARVVAYESLPQSVPWERQFEELIEELISSRWEQACGQRQIPEAIPGRNPDSWKDPAVISSIKLCDWLLSTQRMIDGTSSGVDDPKAALMNEIIKRGIPMDQMQALKSVEAAQSRLYALLLPFERSLQGLPTEERSVEYGKIAKLAIDNIIPIRESEQCKLAASQMKSECKAKKATTLRDVFAVIRDKAASIQTTLNTATMYYEKVDDKKVELRSKGGKINSTSAREMSTSTGTGGGGGGGKPFKASENSTLLCEVCGQNTHRSDQCTVVSHPEANKDWSVSSNSGVRWKDSKARTSCLEKYKKEYLTKRDLRIPFKSDKKN